MNENTNLTTPSQRGPVVGTSAKVSALTAMAARLSVEPAKLLETLKATVFKGATNEELLALVVVAQEYGFNPLLREMYAFPNKKGGIVPVVAIDGWIKIVNRQAQYDGCDFQWAYEEDTLVSCTCTMHVKNRTHPVVVTEFFDECRRTTEPWSTMPKRMLRHKAYMQAARLAFGLSGIYDEDEAIDITASTSGVTVAASRPVFSNPTPPFNEPLPPSLPPKSLPTSGDEKSLRRKTTREKPATAPEMPDAGNLESIESLVENLGGTGTTQVKPSSEPPPTPPKDAGASQNPPTNTPTVQQELAEIVTMANYAFDQFQKWGEQSGFLPEASSYSGFEDVPSPLAKKLVTSKAGLLGQLHQMFTSPTKQ